MNNWETVRLGDVCAIKHGYAFKGEDFSDSPTSYILTTPGNFKIGGGFKCDKPKYYNGEIPNGYILQKDDIIITMTDLSKAGDTLGYSALVPNDSGITYLHNQRVGLVEDISNSMDKMFLYWLLRTRNYQQYIVGCASGSTVKHTSPKSICNYTFLLPPHVEQERIAGILGVLDDKIELNNRINRNLEQQAAALFRRWFVDFEFPDTNGSPYRTAGGTFTNSPLGEIPEGWQAGILGDIANITMGQSPAGTSYNEEENGEVFYQGRAEFGNRFPKRRLFTTEPNRMADENSILMSVRAPVGDINIAYEKCCIGRGLASIKAKNNFNSFVLYTMYSLKDSLNVFNGEGTVFGSINKDNLREMKIIIPNKELVTKFELIVSAMDFQIKTNFFENQTLATLRDTLLPKLMNNEI